MWFPIVSNHFDNVILALEIHSKCIASAFYLPIRGATFFTAKERVNHVSLPQSEITFEAVLLTEPVVVGKVIQTDLLVVSQSKPMKIKARILRDSLTNNYKHLHVGDGIIASARLTEPTNLLGGSFDYARWLRLHDYIAETFIYYNQWQKKTSSP